MKKENSKYGYFNILRFLGAICIAILLHWNDHMLTALQLNNSLSNHKIIYYLSTHSYVFVEMFYIISGFLFAKVYMNRIINNKEYSLKKFMLSRYIRIFPLVIISSIVMYLLDMIYYQKFNLFFSCGNLKFIDLLFDVLIGGTNTFGTSIMPINGPLWYIGPLFICYILAYLLTKIYNKKDNKILFVLPILVGIFIIKTNFNFFLLNYSVSRGLVAFFVGLLLGNSILTNWIERAEKKQKIIFRIIILLILMLYSYCLFVPNSNLFFGSYYDIVLSYSLIFFPLLIILLFDLKYINNLGNTKIFKFLGNISFGIYIWNFPIMIIFVYLIKANILNVNILSWKFFVLNIVIHIFVGSISYLLIEKEISTLLKTKIGNIAEVFNKYRDVK